MSEIVTEITDKETIIVERQIKQTQQLDEKIIYKKQKLVSLILQKEFIIYINFMKNLSNAL